MTTPAQKRGRSRQDYGTPANFLAAVVERFGPLDVDLAANENNAKAPCFVPPEVDSLSIDWTPPEALKMWLNPPFGRIAPWSEKCATTPLCEGARILLLVPASIGASWFSEHVHGRALVLALQPRLTFEGETAPYPKDCILAVYGEAPGFEVWRWK